MAIKQTISNNGLYFITFTCSQWLPLFEEVDAYDVVYHWFDYLKSQGHYITAYVVMPNHVHAMIAFKNTEGKSINSIVGNGKRFMAYEIVKRLERQSKYETLKHLSANVSPSDKSKGKLHEVFNPSFDWKECFTDHFIEQKLSYIHNNPCAGKWNLVTDPAEYVHSSAKFYLTHIQGVYEVTSLGDLEDIDLTKDGD